ncbi:MAG: Ig-like domain-containing protein [Gammaproteobacteria bacterium]
MARLIVRLNAILFGLLLFSVTAWSGELPNDADGDGIVDELDNCVLVANPNQRDSNGDQYGNLCDADFNNDGIVSITDLGLFRIDFFQSGDLDTDLNGDNIVNVFDLGLLRTLFFSPPGPSGLVPIIDVTPTNVSFGNVQTGTTGLGAVNVSNAGFAPVVVSDVILSGASFELFPPTSFVIQPGEPARTLVVEFAPQVAGGFSGNLRIQSNAGLAPLVNVGLSGIGQLPPPEAAPDISASTTLVFQSANEMVASTRSLAVRNTGDAALTVTAASVSGGSFDVALQAPFSFPVVVDPGESVTLEIGVIPAAGTTGTTITGTLFISSDDADEPTFTVALRATVVEPGGTDVNTVTSAALTEPVITASTCVDVTGEVTFSSGSLTGDTLVVTLGDQVGGAIASGFLTTPDGNGTVGFGPLDVCALSDGVIETRVAIDTVTSGVLPTYLGTSAVKNTSPLVAPVLDLVDPVTLFSSIEVCGTSRADTTVSIAGGANTVSTQLDSAETQFCLDVPLRPNQNNELFVKATDDLAAEPRPSALAAPVNVAQISLDDIAIVEVDSEPLTEEEIEQLVELGIIDLDDPSNFNVSMFTIVITIGSPSGDPIPVTISQPIAVPISGSGAPVYGGSTGGGWSPTPPPPPPPSPGTPSPTTPPPSDGGCTEGCSVVVAIPTPAGPVIPGVILIDGRIKTLREFYEVVISILNVSPDFTLADIQSQLQLPGGLTAVAAGPGTELADVSSDGTVTELDLGDIGPAETGSGTFIIRGDSIGTYDVGVGFDGFVTGSTIPDAIAFSGGAGTSVEVKGPPELGVVVRHPSDPNGPDVVVNEIYPLTVEITNLSDTPALYTSLELFLGADAVLVDENDQPLPNSSDIRSFGTVNPGATVSATYRVLPLVQGEILACQAVASENISLTVDTGPDGAPCSVSNTIPANFEPLAVNAPPTIVSVSPSSNEGDVAESVSPFAILTPQSACLIADTWTNVETELIDPANPPAGIQIVSADLVTAGTFYLEELDAFDNPVRHVPIDLTVESPPAGGTTIAIMRLGLESPLSQVFLKPDTRYRATLVGADQAVGNAVCNLSNGVPMENTVQWSFSTAASCDGVIAPLATLTTPDDGALDRPLNQSIVIEFSNPMDVTGFAFDPNNLANSTFGVYQGAMEVGGDLAGGAPVAGSGSFGAGGRSLTYQPSANLPADTTVHVRLTDGLADSCGNALQAPGGVQLFSFATVPPDSTAPDQPLVDPLPVLTNQFAVQVSGTAEPNATVDVVADAGQFVTGVSNSGRFSVSVPLLADQSNALAVTVSDASDNTSSPPVIEDSSGNALVVFNDSTAPQINGVVPVNDATNVARDATISVTFSEPIDFATANGLNLTLSKNGTAVAGMFMAVGDSSFVFTPAALLDFNSRYTLRLRADGVRDLANNGLATELVSFFDTEPFPIPTLTSVAPTSAAQNTTVQVTFEGENLDTTQSIVSGDSGLTGAIVSSTATTAVANITVSTSAVIGATTLGVVTLGGSVSLPFTITDPVPVVTSVSPSAGVPGGVVDAAIFGTGLLNVTDVSIDGSGVTLIDQGTGDATRRDIQLIIDAGAAFGPRTISITTPGGVATGTFTAADLNNPPTVEWISPTGGDWNDPSNWSTGQIPGPTDDVFIATSGVVTHTGTHVVRTLVLFADMQVSGSLTVGDGAALPGLVVSAGHGLTMNANSLMVLAGGMELDGVVRFLDSSGSGTSAARLQFDGAQALTGTGEVVFGLGAGSPASNVIEPINGGTLTIDSGLTIRGGITASDGAGTIGGPNGTTAVLADVVVNGINTNTIIELAGVIDNGGADLRLTQTVGLIRFAQGADLRNAVLTGPGRIVSVGTDMPWTNVTIAGEVALESNTTVAATNLTIDGTLVFLDSSGSGTLAARLQFDGTQTLTGTGEVVFGLGAGSPTSNVIEPINGGTLTIDSGLTIRGGSSSDGAGTIGGPNGTTTVLADVVVNGINTNTIIELAGVIDNGGADLRLTQTVGLIRFAQGADLRNAVLTGPGRIVSVTNDMPWTGVTIAGEVAIEQNTTVSATNLTIDGTLAFLDTSGSGTLAARLQFDGTQTLTGSGEVLFAGGLSTPASNVIEPINGGALTIDSSLTIRAGSATADGSGTIGGSTGTVTLLADIVADGQNTNTVVEIVGTVDNLGGPLRLLPTVGLVRFQDGAQLRNAVLTAASTLTLTANNDLIVQNLTIDGTVRFEDTSGSGGLATRLQFDGTQTLTGTGEILFAGGLSAPASNVIEPINGGTLTIASGLTIQAGSVAGDGSGTIGGIDGTTTLLATVVPGGLSTNTVIAIAGTVDNASGTLTVNDGSGQVLLAEASTLRNAVIAGDGELGMLSDTTLDNVQLIADAAISSNAQVSVLNDLTVDGTLEMRANSARLSFTGIQSLDGTGELRFNSSSVSNNAVEATGSGILTIASGFNVVGRGGTIGGPDGSVVVQGTVLANETGSIGIDADTVQNQGGIGAVNGGTLAIDGTFVNDATIVAGQGSIVSIAGDYTQAASAILELELNGTSGSGRLAVSDDVNLAGALNVTLAAGYVPTLAERIQFMTFDARTGIFDSTLGFDIGGGLALELDTADPLDLELEVVAAP